MVLPSRVFYLHFTDKKNQGFKKIGYFPKVIDLIKSCPGWNLNPDACDLCT